MTRMSSPVDIRPASRKRGNNQRGPVPRLPVLPTKFEEVARKLHLTKEMYTSSHELRLWCIENRNRVYIPEWLLGEWRITVEPTNSDVT